MPGLNIGDVVAEQAEKEGRRCVAILGTAYTMTGPVYPRALSARGMNHMVPEPAERAEIHRIIFDELCCGIIREDSRQTYLDIIERMKARGCDSAALVCTEIPLLVTPDISPLPTLDSTRLLAAAGFEVSAGERPLPSWRGGPVPSPAAQPDAAER